MENGRVCYTWQGDGSQVQHRQPCKGEFTIASYSEFLRAVLVKDLNDYLEGYNSSVKPI